MTKKINKSMQYDETSVTVEKANEIVELILPKGYSFQLGKPDRFLDMIYLQIRDDNDHNAFERCELTVKGIFNTAHVLLNSLNPDCKRCDTGIGRFLYRDSTKENLNKSFLCGACFKKRLDNEDPMTKKKDKI